MATLLTWVRCRSYSLSSELTSVSTSWGTFSPSMYFWFLCFDAVCFFSSSVVLREFVILISHCLLGCLRWFFFCSFFMFLGLVEFLFFYFRWCVSEFYVVLWGPDYVFPKLCFGFLACCWNNLNTFSFFKLFAWFVFFFFWIFRQPYRFHLRPLWIIFYLDSFVGIYILFLLFYFLHLWKQFYLYKFYWWKGQSFEASYVKFLFTHHWFNNSSMIVSSLFCLAWNLGEKNIEEAKKNQKLFL